MNSALIEGAGIYQSGGQSTVEWVSFEQNNGNDYGGAMVMNQASVYGPDYFFGKFSGCRFDFCIAQFSS